MDSTYSMPIPRTFACEYIIIHIYIYLSHACRLVYILFMMPLRSHIHEHTAVYIFHKSPCGASQNQQRNKKKIFCGWLTDSLFSYI